MKQRPATTEVPPVVSAQRDAPGDGIPEKLRRDIMATLISTGLHVVLLLVLAMLVFPSLAGSHSVLLSALSGDSESVDFETIPLAPTELPASSVEAPSESLDTDLGPPVSVELNPTDTPVVDAEALTAKSHSLASFELPGDLSKSAPTGSIEEAVDSVTAELEGRLRRDDLLVVWLLDASHSLVDDRQRVADRLTPFYKRIASQRSSASHQLRSAVVSFGSSMRERVPPTEFGDRIVSAVKRLPIDRSGNEKVFDAVARCVMQYRKSWRDHGMSIVVWTDETGDDGRYLEETIEICKRHSVSVSVVGPSSVLGAETGFHSYVEPKSGSTYLLPVQRGPDTAMPERLELGYWYLTRGVGGNFWGRRGSGLPASLGGQDLQGILSGFSPYALTRLTRQTGGTYTIFDGPQDRSPFDPRVMQAYAPEYVSLSDYRRDNASYPLRQAVLDAVKELAGRNVDAPPMMLFIQQNGPRVFDFMRYYFPPVEFRNRLQSSKNRMIRQATTYGRIVENALRQVSHGGDPAQDLEAEYEQEPSLRWQAWYDLTRGRLLATSVRLREYELTMQAITKPGGLAATTNHVIFVASPQKRSSGIYADRAEEAERLLRRCVSQHEGTPFEVLAQRELDYALGVGVREMALTYQPGGPAPKQPNLPRF
ncbi:MAG: vWA domain-containing protein [Planctomycetota bacterium]